MNFLTSFSPSGRGIPMINDSVFFLGSSYLTVIDNIIRDISPKFLRYVDDYRIFHDDLGQMESILGEIRRKLGVLGLEINDRKLKLDDTKTYLEAVGQHRRKAPPSHEYQDAATGSESVDAEDMFARISTILAEPDRYLHQGQGRFEMAALRRMRFHSSFIEMQGAKATPNKIFLQMMCGSPETITRICDLISEYLPDEQNLWRLLWILYLCRDIYPEMIRDGNLGNHLQTIRSKVTSSKATPEVARLWAKLPANRPLQEIDLEDWHSLDYLERGRRYHA
jgi:hypothetical protein